MVFFIINLRGLLQTVYLLKINFIVDNVEKLIYNYTK